jgi:hypothetical protein
VLREDGTLLTGEFALFDQELFAGIRACRTVPGALCPAAS